MRGSWLLACIAACVPGRTTRIVAVPELPTAAHGAADATASSEQELRDTGLARSGWIYVSMIEGSESAAIDAAREAAGVRGAELIRVESTSSRTFGGGTQAVSPSGHMTTTSSSRETIVIVSCWRRAPEHAHDPPVFGSAWRAADAAVARRPSPSAGP